MYLKHNDCLLQTGLSNWLIKNEKKRVSTVKPNPPILTANSESMGSLNDQCLIAYFEVVQISNKKKEHKTKKSFKKKPEWLLCKTIILNNKKQKEEETWRSSYPSSSSTRVWWFALAFDFTILSIEFDPSVSWPLVNYHSPAQTMLYVCFFGTKSRVLFRFLVLVVVVVVAPPPPIAEPSKNASDNRDNNYHAQDYKDGPKGPIGVGLRRLSGDTIGVKNWWLLLGKWHFFWPVGCFEKRRRWQELGLV